MKKRALLSVSDKTGIVEFARALSDLGYEILSTGGTEKALKEAKIPVTPLEDITQFPECFSGRLKTLHPLVFGGLLFRRDDPDHVQQAAKLDIEPIDIVVVNLYPFEETAAKPGVTREELIEKIDIGGPSLLRAAAKNHSSVTVICDPDDYDRVAEELQTSGGTSP
ncbi:MAG: bifunctional phosphoribosylaminoimidazolecarboxamide formyltransferase/IMP cyclohydrolase, partial [Candidatus Peribacteraceae bacterium]